jgi:hypothetical protein
MLNVPSFVLKAWVCFHKKVCAEAYFWFNSLVSESRCMGPTNFCRFGLKVSTVFQRLAKADNTLHKLSWDNTNGFLYTSGILAWKHLQRLVKSSKLCSTSFHKSLIIFRAVYSERWERFPSVR